MNRAEAIAFRNKIELAAEMQSDGQALESIDLFPKWRLGIEIVRRTGE